MAHCAIERGFAFGMTLDAKAHVDFMHGHNAIHRLNVAVTFLALDAGGDMRLMRKAHEIRQRVDAIPSNLERRPRIIGPWARDLLDATDQGGAVASYASRDRRRTRSLRTPRILMTVLTGNLVDAGVDAMTERDRLFDIGARRPWALRKRQRAESEDQQDNS
jgi:hypothetical protein